MEIEVSMLMEIGVYCDGHIMAYAHDCPEGIGTQTHVGMLAHELKALPLLLHGIVVATQTVDMQVCTLYL